MNNMRAIKINPQDKTVSVVEYTGDYKNIYTHIEAESFDVVRIGDENDHMIFVDDEGLLNDKIATHGMFRFDGDNPVYLAGPALILAHDKEGESVAATLTVPDMYKRVAFGEPLRIGGQLMFVEHTHERMWPMDF
jgi:hypothetical protein